MNLKTARCHPNEPYFALGKCKSCYYRDYNSTKNAKPETKEYWRSYNLKRGYNLTVEQYDNMLRKQSGVCALCGCPQKGSRRLAVDHKHLSRPDYKFHWHKHDGGPIRGLLCLSCNRVAGYLDNAEWREKAIRYEPEWARHLSTERG